MAPMKRLDTMGERMMDAREAIARLSLLPLAFLAGCATVVSNDGERVMLEHDPAVSLATVTDEAVGVCRNAGKFSAQHVATTPKNQHVPSWMSQQISTFRCE